MNVLAVFTTTCIITFNFLYSENLNNVQYTHNYYDKKESIVYIEKTYNKKTYNSFYANFDNYKRRKVSKNEKATKYAIFIGCSLVFGDGLNDNETLPQLFQNQLSQYQSYNYGFCGEGPNNTLYRFQTENIRDQILQKQGVCFLIYPIGWIENRIRLHSNCLHWSNHPYYEYKNQELTYLGSLRKTQKFLYYLMLLYNKIPINDNLKPVFPKVPTSEDYKLLAAIIKEIQKEYTQQFNSQEFYVVIHPLSWGYNNEAIALLKKHNLKVIDLYNINRTAELEIKSLYTIAPWDPHPNSRLNRILAENLAIKTQRNNF